MCSQQKYNHQLPNPNNRPPIHLLSRPPLTPVFLNTTLYNKVAVSSASSVWGRHLFYILHLSSPFLLSSFFYLPSSALLFLSVFLFSVLSSLSWQAIFIRHPRSSHSLPIVINFLFRHHHTRGFGPSLSLLYMLPLSIRTTSRPSWPACITNYYTIRCPTTPLLFCAHIGLPVHKRRYFEHYIIVNILLQNTLFQIFLYIFTNKKNRFA